MKVSVVISSHNRGDKLKRAIDSVLKQSFKDYEIIVVDDASDDTHTRDVIDTFENHEKIILMRLGKNFGSDTKPKNVGIKATRGQYVAFLDDDNVYRPDHLQVLVNELDKSPEITMVYGDRWLIDEAGAIPSQIGKYAEYEIGHLIMENYIDTSDVLVRREALLDVGGFDEAQKKYIDWNLWVRLEKAGYRFKRVPIIITDYFICSDSKSVKVLTDTEKKIMEKTGKFQNMPDWDGVNCDIRLPYLRELTEPQVAIFSLTHDRLEYTKVCFESLYKTAGYDFDHYVIDNGSTDGTTEYLLGLALKEKSNRMVNFQMNTENVGISKGSNQALDMMKNNKDYDIIVKVDNDCLFLTDGWLKRMVELWKSNNNIAFSCYVQGLRDNPGGAPRYHRGMVKGEYIGMTRHLGGICHFVDAKAYKDFRWNENDFLHGQQDLEFSQYLNNHGYAMAYLENYFLEHYKGTEEQEKEFPEYFQRRKIEKSTRYEKK